MPAAAQPIANELADIKMLTNITTSQFTERLVYLMLVDGHYRKYLARLHERLNAARVNVVRAFEEIGLEIFGEPSAGMFIWARFPQIEDALTLAEAAARDGIMLRPAPCSGRISNARRGCGSTSPSAKSRGCSAGCGRRRPARGSNRDAYAQIAIGRPNASRAGGSGNGRARPA